MQILRIRSSGVNRRPRARPKVERELEHVSCCERLERERAKHVSVENASAENASEDGNGVDASGNGTDARDRRERERDRRPRECECATDAAGKVTDGNVGENAKRMGR